MPFRRNTWRGGKRPLRNPRKRHHRKITVPATYPIRKKMAWADGLAIIAPVFWMGFPAILNGWIDRVFSYGFAYTLTGEGWRGDVNSCQPARKNAPLSASKIDPRLWLKQTPFL